MAEETKIPPTAQTPVEPKVEEKKEEAAPKEAAKPTGLDGLTKEQLQDLYKKSPQMFEEAGIVQKKEEKKEPVTEEKKVEPPPAVSAAPKYGDDEIKLPEDVPVDREAVNSYLAHAKEIGLTVKQVQAEVDFQTKLARDAVKRQQAQETPEQKHAREDAANVEKLKGDKEFGAKYEENMEIARRAAKKFGDPALLERLRTSDPVLVKHLWKIGKADAEDRTPGAPNRNGEETKDEEQTERAQHKARFPNSPQMFKD